MESGYRFHQQRLREVAAHHAAILLQHRSHVNKHEFRDWVNEIERILKNGRS